MAKPGNTGIVRVIRATGYSVQGLRLAWRHEAAFRQELALMLVLMPGAFWLGRTPMEITILISSCMFVLIMELLNSAIEAAVDRHGPEHHELSGRAKDLSAAAVFLSLVLLAMVWGSVVYQRFIG